MRIFQYSLRKIWTPFGRMFAPIAAIFVAVVLFNLNERAWFYEGLAVIFFGSLFFFLTLAAIFSTFLYGGFGVGDDGVATFVMGRKVRYIEWKTVTSIEKITYFDTNIEKNRSEFWIRSNSRFVRFDDYIKLYRTLVETMNEYVDIHNIPAFSIDRSIKSRPAQFIVALFGTTNSLQPVVGEKRSPVTKFEVGNR